MLREIKNVRQISGEPSRRWFTDENMDLIIWYEAEEFIGFQLCYDKAGQEKALSWKPETALVHERVDSGESRDGHYKATPILIQNGHYDIEIIRTSFLNNAEKVDKDIRDLVLQCLE